MKNHQKLLTLLTFLLPIIPAYSQVDTKMSARTYIEELTLETISGKVYPNPFSEFGIVEFDNPEGLPCKLEVYGPSGIKVLSVENISGKSIRIERNDLKNGLYFFKLSNNQRMVGKGRFMIK